MSGIRVNPFPMPDLLVALEQTKQQENTATLQLATGSRINTPSDDPAGAAQLVQNRALTSQVDSFLSTGSDVNGQLSTADSTLSSVVTALQRALTLGIQGANGTLSDADRADVAQELSGIRTQLVSLANTAYRGQFIFAGTANVQPYALNSAAPSGVSYSGNAGVNTVTIGNGYQLQVNLPGSQVFSASGSDVFQSITDLIGALQSNVGIGAAVTEVSNAFNYVTSQRVFYGNAENQISSQNVALRSDKLQLASQVNTISGTDFAATATALTTAGVQLNAELAAIGKLSQTNLFDYLK